MRGSPGGRPPGWTLESDAFWGFGSRTGVTACGWMLAAARGPIRAYFCSTGCKPSASTIHCQHCARRSAGTWTARRFAVADVRKLPFRHARFDGALCFGVTQALADSEPAVHELTRSIKPGGQLWIDGLNGWCVIHAFGVLRRRLLGRPRHLRYESPSRITRLLQQCGFSDVQLHWLPIMPGRTPRLQRAVESRPVAWLLRRIPLLGAVACHAFIVHAVRPMQSSTDA